MSEEPIPVEASFAANRSLWEAWTTVHAEGDYYDLDAFREGGVRLREYELEMVGDVAGKSLLHLQCHFGIDTLSWARLGARVTGADFSPKAVELATSLAADLGFPDARFVCSNLYDLPANLDGAFDVVYTSRGVLGWLPDIRRWARGRGAFRRAGRHASSSRRSIRWSTSSRTRASRPGELRLALPVLGAPRAAGLPGPGLVRRSGRRRRRPGRARLGPRARRDRHRARRRRACGSSRSSSTRSSTGPSTSSSRDRTASGACRRRRAASCR